MKKNFSLDSRIRSFSGVSYLSEKQFLVSVERHLADVKAFCYCVHDKDKKKDDLHVLMPVHIHFVLQTFNSHSSRAICRWFCGYVDSNDNDVNTFCEPLFSPDGAVAYLTHSDCNDDYHFRYSESDLKGDKKRFIDLAYDDKDIGLSILQDLLSGVSYRSMALRYGREFILNYSRYIEFADYLRFSDSYKNKIDLFQNFDENELPF